MRIPHLHPWPTDYAEARAIQERLAPRRKTHCDRKRIRLVAGADVSYTRGDDRFFAAVVVFDLKTREVAEVATNVGTAPFPYVPGFLSFRELPTLLDAFAKLEARPDCVMFDGHGTAHPRRFGLAAHGGMILGLPSFGVGKNKLVGDYAEPDNRIGAISALTHKGEEIGAVVRTRKNVKPVFVSCGERMDLARAIEITLECDAGRRIPEPTRLAHLEVNRLRKRIQAQDEI